MPIYLEIFHGRSDPEQSMDDWGESGPIFECRDYVHTTYAADIKLGGLEEGENGVLIIDGGLVYYDGLWYGDWSVFSTECGATDTGEFKARLTKFDSEKAKPPRKEVQGLGVPADLGSVDWASLRHQKRMLESLAASRAGLHERAMFEGLLRLIEHLQDEGSKTLREEVVFG